MTATDKQLAARSEGIGSSDAAAILGYSPWRNAADVQLQKLGKLAPEPASELAEIGTALEPAILKLAGVRLNCRIVRPTGTYRHESGVLLANIDGQVEKAQRGSEIVEAKDSGLDDAWGEAGTSQVPPYTLIQVCHQMLCSDGPVAHVPRLGRGFNRGLFMYRVERDDEVRKLIDVMESYLPKWWQRHIVNQDPIEAGTRASLDTLKRVIRMPNSVRQVDSDKVAAWKLARECRLAAEKSEKESQAALLTELGDSEAGVFEGGAVTYLEIRRSGYTVAPTTYRQLKEATGKQLEAIATRMLEAQPQGAGNVSSDGNN